MKFSILQQDLWPALQSVSRSAGVRAQLPVLGNILISAEEGKVKLSATNLEIGIVKTVIAEVAEEGDITVPSRTLVDVVGNLSGEKLEFSSSAEQLEITTPSFSSQFNGIPAAEFPAIPLVGQKSVTINKEVLLKSLPQVGFSAAVDDGRPILTGILTEIKDKKLQLVATDGYRLAYKTVPVEEDASFKALVPRRTFEEVVRVLGEEQADTVQIATSDNQNQIIFTIGSTQLSSRLIEGQFPAWEKIVPVQYVATISADRQDFLKAVKLASVFAKTDANVVSLQNTSGKLLLSSEAKELGSQHKEIDAQTEGEGMQIAFNTKFLQDALSAINTSQVVLQFSGGLSAAVMRSEQEEGLRYIIMPVNLS